MGKIADNLRPVKSSFKPTKKELSAPSPPSLVASLCPYSNEQEFDLFHYGKTFNTGGGCSCALCCSQSEVR